MLTYLYGTGVSMYTIILMLLITHGAKNMVPPKELAKEIIRLSAIYKVDPEHATRVILVESRGVETAYNAKSNDFGLTQINIVNAKAMGINSKCLFNWRCNLKHGIQIMARKKHARKCAYNLGIKGSRDVKKQKICEIYENKLASLR